MKTAKQGKTHPTIKWYRMELTMQDLELTEPSIHINQRTLILNKVREWGHSSTDAILDPSTKIFSVSEVDGLIGYRIVKGCAIVYGDPVCSPSDVALLTKRFHQFCDQQKKTIVYIAASEDFAKWALKHYCKALVEFGKDLFLNPQIDNPKKASGSYGCLVRRKVKHATNEGVIAQEYLTDDSQLEKAIEAVGTSWLNARQGPQIHISNVHLFNDRTGKRWFYATHKGQVIGVLVLNQLIHLGGWHLNHLMVVPNAPGGTPETLVMTAFETVAAEKAHYLSFGSITAPELGEVQGLGRLSSQIAYWAFKFANYFFGLQGRKGFWEKFQPRTAKTYLLFSRSIIGIKELNGLMCALNVSVRPK